MENAARLIDQLSSAFEAHGYVVMAEPIPGSEELFVNELRAGFAKIEATMARNAKAWGTRGRSARALRILHLSLPSPTWLVELAA